VKTGAEITSDGIAKKWSSFKGAMLKWAEGEFVGGRRIRGRKANSWAEGEFVGGRRIRGRKANSWANSLMRKPSSLMTRDQRMARQRCRFRHLCGIFAFAI